MYNICAVIGGFAPVPVGDIADDSRSSSRTQRRPFLMLVVYSDSVRVVTAVASWLVERV